MFSEVFLNASFLPAGVVKMDQALFRKINGEWHNRLFDAVFPFIREPFFWAPLYFFLVLLVILNFRKRGWSWVLFLAATVMVSDYTSSTLIKGAFARLRPCRDPDLAHSIRFIVSYCPVSSSFVSSHAVNHFAIATFIFVTFSKVMSKKWGFIFLWAAAICYAQVYVGVHFPLDVFCGTIVGILIGLISATIFNRTIRLESHIKI